MSNKEALKVAATGAAMGAVAGAVLLGPAGVVIGKAVGAAVGAKAGGIAGVKIGASHYAVEGASQNLKDHGYKKSAEAVKNVQAVATPTVAIANAAIAAKKTADANKNSKKV